MHQLQRYNNTCNCAVTHLGGGRYAFCFPLAAIVCFNGYWQYVTSHTCALIEPSLKLSTYKQPQNMASCKYKLVDAVRVCWSIYEMRGRPETRSCTVRSAVATWNSKEVLPPLYNVIAPSLVPGSHIQATTGSTMLVSLRPHYITEYRSRWSVVKVAITFLTVKF